MSARHNIERAVELLGELVGFPTVSARSNLALIRHVAGYLDALGVSSQLSYDPSGEKANLFATIGPEVDGGVVLCGHTDVVPADGRQWESDPFTLLAAEGALGGRGTADMKGFIACTLAEVPALLASDLRRPVHLAYTFDEEIGTCGVPHLIRQMADRPFRPCIAIVGEPTEMRIIAGHKGGLELTTTITGLESHAASPAKGVNAISYAVRLISKIEEEARALAASADPQSPFDPPHSTISIGTIRGGAARNIVAGSCAFEWEVRLHPGDDGAAILRAIETNARDVLLPEMRARSPSADIVTEIEASFPGLAFEERSEAVALIRELNGSDSCQAVSFGTDAGHFQRAGISTVIFGPGSIEQAHKPNEFIALEQMEACMVFLARLRDWLSRDR